MAYEYAKEVAQVSNALLEVVDKLMDEVPDQEQILELIMQAQTIFLKAASVMSAEEKKEFKAKFIAKVALSTGSKALDKFIVDEE